MCCLALIAGFIGPRVALFIWWVFGSKVDAAFDSWVWPLLGLVFLPWTTLAYVIAWGPLEGVSGLGWLLADEVGRKMGIKPEDSSRIEAGIDYYYYENVANDGHTRVRGEELLYPEALPSLLGIRASLISEKLEKSLIPLGNGWYTSEVHRKNAEVIAGFFLEQ